MYEEEWVPIDDTVYLDNAAHAVMPRAVAAAVQEAIVLNQRPDRFDDAQFFTVCDRLRMSLATLLGASPHEIALVTGATTGLQILAHHLRWNAGDEVVITARDFPMQYSVWKPMEARAGAAVKMVAPSGRFLSAADIVEAITPRTRVVSVAHVRFDDGSLLDTRPVAEACRKNGAVLVLDVSQSCGSIPMDVKSLGADVLVGAGYKWLLSPYGTGFLWVKDALLDELLPGPFAWTGQSGRTFAEMNMVDPTASRDAKRFDAAETATDFNLNLVAMAAGLDVVLRIGPESVARHNRAWIDAMFRRLPDAYTPASPLDANVRGVFGCFSPRDAATTTAVAERLRAANVVVSIRGGRIRVSPHLFNTEEHLDRLIDAL